MAMRWYVVHVFSGFEKRVSETIRELSEDNGIGHLFEEILVPTQEVLEVRRGKRVKSERKFFPGYVLIKAELTDDAWHLVKGIPRVTGFLGASNRPVPVSEREVNKILQQVEDGTKAPRPSILYTIGEQVRVTEGPFASFNGVVEDVDEERARLKVSVAIFGRSTPVELEYTQVEKA